MVATPHSDGRARWDSVDSLRALCNDMNRVLASEGVALALTLGMENPLELDTADKLERGAALTLNGSPYVLVELPFDLLPLYWSEALFQLQLRGFRPIIAHPERQAQIQNNPQLLAGPVGRGVLSQVTAGSLSGHFGPRAKKTAEFLCKRELVHVISSDCHGPDGARGPDIRDGLDAAARLVGKETAARMASETPRAMIEAAS
jgi:protein-tyrosine phosphatase